MTRLYRIHSVFTALRVLTKIFAPKKVPAQHDTHAERHPEVRQVGILVVYSTTQKFLLR